MRILLVEDEADIAANLQKYLRKNEFEVDIANSLHVAWEFIQSINYPVVILDRMLPDGDGLTLIAKSHGLNSVPRFLVLSALDKVDDKVEGLDVGANDYLTKPFEPKELLARVQAMLRIARPRDNGTELIGNLRYDRGTRQFYAKDHLMELRRREHAILEVLITRSQQIVSRAEIIDQVYGFDEYPSANTIDSHLSRLRQKLSQTSAGVNIHTARNLGYLLKVIDA